MVLPDHLMQHSQLCIPDFFRVMLDPPRLGKELSEFLLRNSFDLALFTEEDGTGTRGPLIEGNDILHRLIINNLWSTIERTTEISKRLVFHRSQAQRRESKNKTNPKNPCPGWGEQNGPAGVQNRVPD